MIEKSGFKKSAELIKVKVSTAANDESHFNPIYGLII